MNRTAPDVELALQIDETRRAQVNASSVYFENGSKLSDAFAKCVLGHRDKVHVIATPLAPSKYPISVQFKLKIQKEQLI